VPHGSEIVMKKLIVLFLPFIIACEPRINSRGEGAISPEAKRELLSIIHGGWVKQEYVDSITKTKSPYRSSKLYLSNIELIIDTTNVIGDTIMNPGCSTNGKESYYFKIVINHDSLNNPTMQMLYNHNYINSNLFLEYSISSGDTILYIVKEDISSKKIKSKIPYQRIYKNPPGNNYSIDPTIIFLNRTLMAGNYKLYNAKNGLVSKKVEFREDGQVEGFPEFKNYYLENYYGNATSNNYNFDYIVFSSPEKRSVFRWTLEKGIFKFYDVIPNAQPVNPGILRYTLKKEN
jgi:hypothetical protein